MQYQFDKVDFPPGVEAPLPWLNDRDSSANIPPSTRTLTISDIPDSKKQAAATSGSSIPADSKLKEKVEANEDAVMQKLQQFKQFDIVDDFSDHHFSRMGFSDGKVMEVTYRYVYVVYFWKGCNFTLCIYLYVKKLHFLLLFLCGVSLSNEHKDTHLHMHAHTLVRPPAHTLLCKNISISVFLV